MLIHDLERAELAMEQKDRVYYARRAAEELELAMSASDEGAAEAHRRLQRAYLERASVGDRPFIINEIVG